MMKRLFLSLFWCAVSWLQVSAQQKFVDKLVKPVNGQGTVRVIQDAEITRMVNSRTARQEAQRMAGKVKSYFSDMATYTHFQSPRWICRVGDFRTYEEANQALHELRATKQFDEALIVKSVIQIPY